MTFQEAIEAQHVWLSWWLNWLIIGTFVLPAALVIWRKTPLAGIVTVAVVAISGFGVVTLFERLGYVKLLGLPHVILWTPLVIWLIALWRRPDLPVWPRWILSVVIATLLVSLVFDYVDVLRYLLGERAPMVAAS